MTIVVIKNLLINYFLSYSSFSIEEDLDTIQIDDGQFPDFVVHKRAIVVYGLNELVKLGVIAEVTPGKLYVLNQPITSLNQTLTLSSITCAMVADLTNGWLERTGEFKATGRVVNKLGILNDDVAYLCGMCHALLDMNGIVPPGDGEQGEVPQSPKPPAGKQPRKRPPTFDPKDPSNN